MPMYKVEDKYVHSIEFCAIHCDFRNALEEQVGHDCEMCLISGYQLQVWHPVK